MTIGIGQVIAALNRLLQEVENAAVTADVELPDRRYTTTGGAVYDCAQVTVSGNSMTTGIAGAAEGGVSQVGVCVPGWTLVVELAIVRNATEMPGGRRGTTIPAPADIERDTATADADAAILVNAIEAIAGPEWDQLGQIPASIQFGEVQGGLTAVVLTVTVNLWDVPVEA